MPLTFSTGNLALVGGSWDSTIRLWNMRMGELAFGESRLNLHKVLKVDAPVLSCASAGEGKVAYGMLNHVARLWDVEKSVEDGHAGPIVARHDQAVIFCGSLYHPDGSLDKLVTASWDGKMKIWDLRQAPTTPISTTEVGRKVLGADMRRSFLAAYTPETLVSFYDLSDIRSGSPYMVDRSATNLEHQFTSIAVFTECDGYAVGSLEGRCMVQYIKPEYRNNQNNNKSSFAFKCHRHSVDKMQSWTPANPPVKTQSLDGDLGSGRPTHLTFPITSISFHPTGIFSTAGSDGVFNFWNKEKKSRLKEFVGIGTSTNHTVSEPVSHTDFSEDGAYFAYAVGYDWHQGSNTSKQDQQPSVGVHCIQESEIQKQR